MQMRGPGFRVTKGVKVEQNFTPVWWWKEEGCSLTSVTPEVHRCDKTCPSTEPVTELGTLSHSSPHTGFPLSFGLGWDSLFTSQKH
jgi:hypothetical protein